MDSFSLWCDSNDEIESEEEDDDEEEDEDEEEYGGDGGSFLGWLPKSGCGVSGHLSDSVSDFAIAKLLVFVSGLKIVDKFLCGLGKYLGLVL